MFKFDILENDELVVIVSVIGPTTVTQFTFFKDNESLTQYAKLFLESGKTMMYSWGSSTTLFESHIKNAKEKAVEYLIEQGLATWKDKGYSSLLVYK